MADRNPHDRDMSDLSDEDVEFLGFLAGDFAEDGALNFFGAFDVDLLDLDPDDTLPF